MSPRSWRSLILIVIALPIVGAGAQQRLASPPPASLAVPAAAGALRILLVDDDWSENNHSLGDRRLSASDTVFRRLVADAVGGDAKAWDIQTVEAYKSGPGAERLSKFNLIVWYTGANYGGGADNVAALSVEDEKTVRRYLEETDGTVMLISPGYAERALGYGSTWDKSEWPFLSEVMGVRGGAGLAQRFEAGMVTSSDGKQFNVGTGAPPETQFSAVNPAGASVLFTSLLKSNYSTGAPMPVAIANAYGRGRIIYVGFTFEKLAEADLAPAFQTLIAASGIQATPLMSVSRTPATTTKTVYAGPATVQVTGTPTTAIVRWTLPTATVTNVSLDTPAQTVKKPSAPLPQAPGQPPPLTVERLVPNTASVRLSLASPDATQASDPGPLAPGQTVTYRVTVTDARGTGYKEATYTPPLPKDPAQFTAARQADGSIMFSWSEVPGVQNYKISILNETYIDRRTGGRSTYSRTDYPAPYIAQRTTEWRGPVVRSDESEWTVASVYEPDGVLTAPNAWTRATALGKPAAFALPTPRRQFLSMPNGTGSYAITEAHYRSQCIDALLPGSLCHAADFLNAATNWEEAWHFWKGRSEAAPARWPRVFSFSSFDLGKYRQSNCAPPRNGSITCWAISHNPGKWDFGSKMPDSLSVIIMNGDKSFFGRWEFLGGETLHDYSGGGAPASAFDVEHSFAIDSTLVAGAALDRQGRKNVPNACLSCHGGYYDSVSKRVVGASLLPIIPARALFGRSDDEVLSPSSLGQMSGSDSVPRVYSLFLQENIRGLNEIVLQSNPAPAIIDQINALYDGEPNKVGKTANNNAVPSGWRNQQGLYKKVIEPYCASCHFAQRGPVNLRSWGNALQNKDAIQRTVCTEFTMPHSEIQFQKFWSEGSGGAPDLLSTSLGFQKCR